MPLEPLTMRRRRPSAAMAGVAIAGLLLTGLVAAPASSAEGSAPAPAAGTTDQLIVTAISTSVSDASLEQVTQKAAEQIGADVTAEVTRDLTATTSVIRLDEALPIEEAKQLSAAITDFAQVRRAEPDVIVRPAVTLPNDQFTSSQWGLWQSANDGGFSTRAPAAWPTSRGSDVVVAVLDTGRTAHPDLDANTVAGYDFISVPSVANDGNGRDSDPSDPGDWKFPYGSTWHGTHVAGTIAAVTDNGVGVAGVAPSAKVQHVRVLGTGGGYMSDIADAIRWASGDTVSGVPANPTPAKVLNLSLGGSGPCDTYTQNAINTAVARGSVVVVAAGNDNLDVSGFTPANCLNVLTVASHTSTGARSSFSNFGAGIEISGPGSSIISTYNTGSTVPGSPTYATASGTSMATPHVAGVAALAFSADPTLNPARLTTLLQSTAQAFPAGSTCTTSLCGAGYVDARAAITSLDAANPSNVIAIPDYASLDVSWTAPFGSSPTHYDVEYSTDGTTWTADDSVAGTSTTIDGLNPASTYTVRVRAIAGGTPSAWVTSAPATPLALALPGPVGAVTGVVNDTSLSMSWTPPSVNGGSTIAYYTVGYSTDESTWIADDTTATTSTVIDGLSNGTAYRVRIAAVNQVGAGASTLSNLLTPRTLTAPGAPSGFTAAAADSGIALRWSTPSDDGGREVDGYLLQYSSDKSNWNSIPGTYLGYDITILGLTNGTLYTVRVAAKNVIGTGPWSTATATPVGAVSDGGSGGGGGGGDGGGGAPPPAPAPVISAAGAPTLTQVIAGDRTITARWRTSDDTGGEAPGEFTVELSGPDGTQTSTSISEYAEFDGLVNGAEYRVRVAATNSAGTGDFSAWSEPVTPSGLPVAPTSLAGSARDGGVDLRWTAPTDTGGSAIEDYVVQWTSDGVEVTLTTAATSVRLATLANGTRYTFRVAARNAAGLGSWSAPLSLTPRAAPVSAPDRVTLQRSGRKIAVAWAAPTVGKPLRYVVATSVNGAPFRIQKFTKASRTTLAVAKRTQSITIRVRAIDSYGPGPWSELASVRLRR